MWQTGLCHAGSWNWLYTTPNRSPKDEGKKREHQAERRRKTKNEYLIYRRIMTQQQLLRKRPVATAASSPCLRRRAWWSCCSRSPRWHQGSACTTRETRGPATAELWKEWAIRSQLIETAVFLEIQIVGIVKCRIFEAHIPAICSQSLDGPHPSQPRRRTTWHAESGPSWISSTYQSLSLWKCHLPSDLPVQARPVEGIFSLSLHWNSIHNNRHTTSQSRKGRKNYTEQRQVNMFLADN